MKINVRKTIENTVTVDDEFPFYVEELSSNGEMPTLLGLSDEKYLFDEMDDEFFEFIERKISENGVYIRLVHIIEISRNKDLITFEIESGSVKTTIETSSNIPDEVTDIGIKIRGDNITVGKTSYSQRPHFEKLNEDDFLSMLASEMFDDLIFLD